VIVVDASVIAPAVADDEPSGDRARARLHGEHLIAPDVLDLEVTSAVRSALRTGDLDERRAGLALVDLAVLAVHRIRHRSCSGASGSCAAT
jgi:predicted nucleic acid-binding protein